MSALEIALVVLHTGVLLAQACVFGTLAVQIVASRKVGNHLLAWLFPTLLVLMLAWLTLQTLVLTGDVTDIWLVLTSSVVGNMTALRWLVWLLAWALWRWTDPRLSILPAITALVFYANVTHAAVSGDAWLRAAGLAHIFGAVAWVGSLPALWLALDGPGAARIAKRYTWFGLSCVAVIVVTAFVQAQTLAGGVVGLLGTDYGHAILVKIALLLVLLALALRHRFTLAPRLPESLGSLRRSVLTEAVIGLVVLSLASLLSSLPPGEHVQPNWPFSWRVSFDLMDDDELRREVTNAARALGGAGLILLLAILARRIRWIAVATALVIAWLAIPHFDLLFLPAEPTYFWQSTSGNTPGSIAAGKTAYAQNCASCHGVGGAGDGPQAKGMRIPPADLTAAHLWDHPDGELYWWISHGMNGPDNRLVMPGFGEKLDDDTIWSIIDFLHDNNPNKPEGGAAATGHMMMHH